jgi:hypothetical protein
MVFSLALVEFLEPLSQPMGLNARDGVFSGVEDRLGAPKHFGRNVVFVELVALAMEILLSYIA